MSNFTDNEIAYIKSQRLGRLATISADGPHVVPVSFSYNAESDSIDIGGRNFSKSKKFRDMQADPRVSFVIDDVLPPWQPRGIEIRGMAHAVTARGGSPVPNSDDTFIRIAINKIVSWGIDGDPYQPNSRKVEPAK